MIGRNGFPALWVFTFPYAYPGLYSPVILVKCRSPLAAFGSVNQLVDLDGIGLRRVSVNGGEFRLVR